MTICTEAEIELTGDTGTGKCVQSLQLQRETIQGDIEVLLQKKAALGKQEVAMRHATTAMEGYHYDPPCMHRVDGSRPPVVRQLLRFEGQEFSESECSELELSESKSDPADRLSDMSDIEEWMEEN